MLFLFSISFAIVSAIFSFSWYCICSKSSISLFMNNLYFFVCWFRSHSARPWASSSLARLGFSSYMKIMLLTTSSSSLFPSLNFTASGSHLTLTSQHRPSFRLSLSSSASSLTLLPLLLACGFVVSKCLLPPKRQPPLRVQVC